MKNTSFQGILSPHTWVRKKRKPKFTSTSDTAVTSFNYVLKPSLRGSLSYPPALLRSLPTLPTDPETPPWGFQHHWEVFLELRGLYRPLEERKPNCTFKNSSNSKFHLLPKIDLWDQKVLKVMFSRINISNFWGEALFVNQGGVCAGWVCLGDKQHLFCEGKDYLWNFYFGKRETISRSSSLKAVWISRNVFKLPSFKMWSP